MIGVLRTRDLPNCSDEAGSDLERAAVFGNVLADQDHLLVGRHRLPEAFGNRVQVAQLTGRPGRRTTRERLRRRMDVRHFPLGRGHGIGRRDRRVRQAIDLRLHLLTERVALGAADDAALVEQALEAQDRVLRPPLVEERGRDVVGPRGLLVPAHTERLELDQRRPFPVPRPRRHVTNRRDDCEQIVAVSRDSRHPVADGAIGERTQAYCSHTGVDSPY